MAGKTNGSGKSDVCIRRVPLGFVTDVWPTIKTWVDEALDYHDFMDAEDSLLHLLSGHFGCYVAIVDDKISGCVLAEIQQYPKTRALNIVILGGKKGTFSKWSEAMMQVMISEGTNMGCSGLSCLGRPGWLKAGKRLGFVTQQRAILFKELSDGRRQGRRPSNDHGIGTVGADATTPDPGAASG